jgi:hypothetical protein
MDVEMKIVDDLAFEGKETATLTLTSNNSYKIAASAKSGTVKIADND